MGWRGNVVVSFIEMIPRKVLLTEIEFKTVQQGGLNKINTVLKVFGISTKKVSSDSVYQTEV